MREVGSPNKRRHKSTNKVKTGSGKRNNGVCSNPVIRKTCLCLEGSGGAAAPQFYKLGDQVPEKGRPPRPLNEAAQTRVSQGGPGASATEGTSGRDDTCVAKREKDWAACSLGTFLN